MSLKVPQGHTFWLLSRERGGGGVEDIKNKTSCSILQQEKHPCSISCISYTAFRLQKHTCFVYQWEKMFALTYSSKPDPENRQLVHFLYILPFWMYVCLYLVSYIFIYLFIYLYVYRLFIIYLIICLLAYSFTYCLYIYKAPDTFCWALLWIGWRVSQRDVHYSHYASLTARSLSTLVTPQCNPTMCNRTSCAQVHELP